MGDEDLAESRSLVANWERIQRAREKAYRRRRVREANRFFDQATDVYVQLKARGPAHQALLLPLLDSDDEAVRLDAAVMALEFAPDEGEKMLEEIVIAGSEWEHRWNAHMSLAEWRAGRLTFPPHPTTD